MGKYNISELKTKKAEYRHTVSSKMMDIIQEQIINIIVKHKAYRDKDYSAKKLAKEIGTNTRYISAVVNDRFHMNYSQFVNKYRVDEAMRILSDMRYQDLAMSDICDMVGFANRQTFYASFYRFIGVTPRQYRLDNMKKQKS
jgi:AraC-like DNA-binding protein